MSRGVAVAAAMVLMVGLACTSCSNERRVGGVEEGNELLSFAPTISDTWAAAEQQPNQGAETTRANADSGIGSVVDAHSLMLGEVAGDSLYLHITTTEGIEGSAIGTVTEGEGLRAAPVTNMRSYGGFGVTAYHYKAGSSASGTPNLMNREQISVERATNIWKSSTPHHWLPSKRYDFYAWAPYSTTGYSVNSPTGGAAPTITVTIPNRVADQKDLLVAKATGVTEPSSGGRQQLDFNHALTAVRFVAKEVNAGIEITRITLEGVLNQGTYDFRTEQWTPRSGQPRVSFTQTLSRPVTSTGVSGQEITGGATTFMMLPQQFNSSTPLTVKVSYSDGGTAGEIRGIISTPHRWEAGKTVTYEISSSSINYSYTFAITQAPTSVPHTGGSSNFRITSTRRKGTAGAPVEPVSFEIKKVYDEATGRWTTTIPSWFNGGNTISSTGGTNVGGSISIVAQTTSTQGIPGLATLQNATPKGTRTAPYTLEDEGGTVPAETANCYVIQAPGHYSLRLVYGNAITNGTPNSSAYTSTALGEDILNPFINHLGQGITRPDLPTPVSAGIVWQDEKDLVTDVRLDTSNPSNMRLLFEVNKNNIREGNAVVAVYDSSNRAIWSWHIWVTAQDVFTPISVKTGSDTGYSSQEIKFMPCNLGEARGTTDIFPRRALRAKVVQTGSNREVEVTFVQNEGTEVGVGVRRSPYYQWGRKDPFIPSNGINNTNQTWYDSRGNGQTSDPTYTFWGNDSASVQNSIANPGTGNTNSRTTYRNLWNSNNTETTVNNNRVVKTIYDPSPRGYAMPPSAAFTGFNKSDGTFDKGWHFRTGYPAPNNKIYFPASGYRDGYRDPNIDDVGYFGYYWSAGTPNVGSGYCCYFDSSGVYPLDSNYRVIGFSVRPAKII